MIRRVLYLFMLLGVVIGLFVAQASPTVKAQGATTASPSVNSSDFAVVDPNYIYDQLFYMATHFLRREAGFDTNLPPDKNGHDEFASYWTQEMFNNLQGFGAQVRRDSFLSPTPDNS